MELLVGALSYKFDSRWRYWHNPTGHTMDMRPTQPLTEMSTRNMYLGVKAASA